MEPSNPETTEAYLAYTITEMREGEREHPRKIVIPDGEGSFPINLPWPIKLFSSNPARLL